MNSKVSIVRCNTYDASSVLEATRKAVDLIAGIANYIKPGSRVLVKPNLLMAKGPEFGITTHPAVIRAVARLLKEINCKMFIGDGPSVWGNQIEDVDQVYESTGIKRIAEEEGMEIVKFDKRRWRNKFPLTTWLDDCDYCISIAKFKTHDWTILTGAIKNLFGLVPGAFKTTLHKNYYAQRDFARILVDIYEQAKPALTIVDGIVAMEGDGPGTGGRLCNTGLLLAGSDCAALDSVLSLIMGLRPEDILTNREAAKRGLGVMELSSIQVIGERLEDVVGEPFRLPSTTIITKIPRPLIDIAKKLIRFYPIINPALCMKCGACIKACPQKVIQEKNGRVIIDYSDCISCFCCQETCPYAAITVRKSLLAKLLRL